MPKLEEMIINTGKINISRESLPEVIDIVLWEIVGKIKGQKLQEIYTSYFGKKIKRKKLERYGILQKTYGQLKSPFDKL